MANRIISIIIVNYRSAAFTKACLGSIYVNNDPRSVEVIVVDNASNDGCAEMMQSDYPNATFIQSAQNVGFSGANNLGITAAHGSYILFLNPDTEIEGNAIQRLVEALDSIPKAGMVGARLLNSDRSVQTTCITAFPSILNQVLGTEYLRQRFPNAKLWGIKPLFGKVSTPVAVDAISGACMLARKGAIEEVHGFTTDYFMYAEDLDLCLKLKKAGWKVYYVPDSVIVHHGGRSSEARPESSYAEVMIRESMYQFMQAHRGRCYAWLFRGATALVAICRVILMLAISPVMKLSERPYAMKRIWRKWTRILAWCVGLQQWARREGAMQAIMSPKMSASQSRSMAE